MATVAIGRDKLRRAPRRTLTTLVDLIGDLEAAALLGYAVPAGRRLSRILTSW